MAEAVEAPEVVEGPDVQPEPPIDQVPAAAIQFRFGPFNTAPSINDRLKNRFYMRTNPDVFDSDDAGNPIDPRNDTVEPALPPEPVEEVPPESPVTEETESSLLEGWGRDTENRDIRLEPAPGIEKFTEDIVMLGEVLPDVVRGVLSGTVKGVENIAKLDSTGILKDTLLRLDPTGILAAIEEVTGPLAQPAAEKILDFLGVDPGTGMSGPLIDPPTTTPGKLAEGFAQFVPGIIPATKVARLMIGTSTIIRRVAAELLGGAVGDFATSSEAEAEGLVGLVKKIPLEWAQKFGDTLEHFITKGGGEEIDEFRARLLGSVPGIIITPIVAPLVEGLIKIASSALKSRAGKDLVEVFDEVEVDGVAGSGGLISGGQTGGARGERVSTTGQYIGAPKGIVSPQALGGLRRKLQKITVKGEPGRFWYERSSRQILDAVGGDIEDADKLVQLIGIFSSGTDVSSNFNYALQAFTQAKAGLPIKSGRFPVRQSKAAQDVMDGIPWGGRKTNNFYNNLMVHIDPKRAQGVTTDIWIMRAFGFKNPDGTPFGLKQKDGKDGLTRPTDAQYDFVEKEIFKIAGEMGWEPQQVQAAMWVAEKARFEGTSVALAKFDFADALKNNLGQVSWESIHGRTSGHMPEMRDAPYKQQVEYHQAVSRVFLDDAGNDIIAKRLGVPSPREFEAPGHFEGKTSPGTQTEVALPRLYKGPAYGKIDPGAAALVDAYAAVRGILLKQDSVGWHRPFYNATIDASNGIEVRVGRKLSTDETKRLAGFIADEAGHTEYNPISSPLGTRIINFDFLVKKSDGTPLMADTWIDHEKLVTNKEFHAIVGRALDRMNFDGGVGYDAKRFASQNGYLGNDWGVGKNGEGYLESSLKGRPDLHRKIRDIVEELGPRIDELDNDFSRRYGWTLNREINSGNRRGLAQEVIPPAAAIAAPLLLGGSEQRGAELNEGGP